MLRLGLGPQIGTNTPADSGGAQVIWKVAVYGAGTPTSNGEYVWDGTTLYNGKPVYSKDLNAISWDEFSSSGIFEWGIYDDDISFTSYVSYDLISWSNDRGDGTSPAPSSALSYAQDSFISSITLTDANIATSNGTYSRISGSTTQFDKVGSTNFIFNDGVWIVADYDEGTDTYQSNDLFVWSSNLPEFDPPPIVSAMVYSA